MRPVLAEVRLSAFKRHRGAAFGLAPVTVFAGPGGSGKTSVLEALSLLALLGRGEAVEDAIAAVVRGGAGACAPQGGASDGQGRRGFRLGCSVAGPQGTVRLDLAVQTEPEVRVVGERLTAGDRVLLSTALRDPARRCVEAVRHTADGAPGARTPLPDDRLVTASLPLRVAGSTPGQRLVVAAAEQVLVALRSVFPVDPRPERMRGPVPVGDGRLRGGCDNLSAVLHRTRDECRTRHAALVAAAREACAGPVAGVVTVERGGSGRVMAALDRGPLGLTPFDRLGDGELRFLAMALVLLTGPDVLEMDHAAEVPAALQAMTVLADGLDTGMDAVQTRQLLSLAARATARGHVRVAATAYGTGWAGEGAEVIELGEADGE
ncbi:bldA-regulated nucleotide binding protein [Streptantibioticus cattleyicolor NRRL 8057 = DSM 46488]|uniref:BldA-regulated nucleotide binding protein n=1 Tax=Streptantibioticus cattleyicolor (strain ATCC 35852 / DSM 46488 / JCM 4925 / NBRC 14057 / NRRL 8057) TaxID=1003195 RepID=G8X3G9_STREN|nr:hypothetical protein [Streptantibioticus cattleyicolor]AEW97020.1 bldA-regulated nucleotide binding protein [Streptantibioticus cattleyicolor NRRL 8057 = DSM 46488]